MTVHRDTILLNLLAAGEGGQVTRARSFLERLSSFDPLAHYCVLKVRGTLPFCQPGERLDVREVDLGVPGIRRALLRTLWENVFIARTMRAVGASVYLTFSHYLPATFPRSCAAVVGVSNLAPFSALAWNAETSVSRRLKMRLLRAGILSSARRATAVIALSNACRRVLEQHGIDGARISVVSNGVSDPPPVQPRPALLRERGIEGGFLLSVAHFHRYKNFERLIEAFVSLPVALRERFPLIIIGKPTDRDYFRHVAAQVERASEPGRIHIIPGLAQEQLYAYYQHATLFVFPSLVENSPNILLEAMSCGLPVACGRIAPMPEFGGQAAAYFDPLSAIDMAEVLERTLCDADLLAGMRERSFAQAKKYTWNAFTEGVVAICAGARATDHGERRHG